MNFWNVFEKVSQCRKLCQKWVIPNLYTLRRTPECYCLSQYIDSAPNLNTCITYLNTLSRLFAPYLNTCITYLNKLNRLSAPYLADSAANQNQALRHTLGSRQPIKIEYYVTRVASQSESSITSPECSRLAWTTVLGSRLESARYSLS